MEHSKWERKVIRRLDFENCEITTIKMKKKYRKRIKAKLTKELEEEVCECPDLSSQTESIDCSKRLDLENSPVLYKSKRKNSKKHQKKLSNPSPILITNKKRKTCRKEGEPSTSTDNPNNSPILVFKSTKKRRKNENNKNLLIEDDDPEESTECEIEDFSQEFQPELKGSDQDLKISSFSSESRAFSEIITPLDQSRETTEEATPNTPESRLEEELLDSGRKRKRNKKEGLVEKLIKMRKRQASERRIWEHKKKVMKVDKNWSSVLNIVDIWNDGALSTLKCVSLDENSVRNEYLYVILDKNISGRMGKGTSFRIAAPWKEIQLLSLNTTVLVSVSHLEVIENIPGITIPKMELEQIQEIKKYKEEVSSIFDALLQCEN